jgi:hypothetical protein
MDIYGEPIKLHYKSSTEFKTFTGGIMSLLTYCSMSIVAIFSLLRLRFDYNPIFSEYMQFESDEVHLKDLHPFKNDLFDLAVAIVRSQEYIDSRTSIGTLTGQFV